MRLCQNLCKEKTGEVIPLLKFVMLMIECFINKNFLIDQRIERGGF
ncbi:hypothetical protein T458_02470 [Brevibacillus panacihumi W25]|uniref:Uncharacterized protein n=1 Tax=Brevibacillus panacihumi W25 TaxID=1408254 RepID=V6MFQ1_9BACL|nr:hypothetical protein T458_02470 [Brevibacillus panacihumi W25]